MSKLNMLTFTKGIGILKANYLNWKFDLNDKMQINIWYSKLSPIGDKVFMQLVEWYISNNELPPRTPLDLSKCYRKIFESQYPSKQAIEQEIYEWVREYDISDNGFRSAMRKAPWYIWELNNGKGISYYTYEAINGENWRNEIEMLANIITGNFKEEIESKCGLFVLGKINLPLFEDGQVMSIEDEKKGITSLEMKEISEGLKQLERECKLK